MLAAVGDLAALEQDVEVGRMVSTADASRLSSFGTSSAINGDHHARLVQHDVAERDAVVERGAGEVSGRRAPARRRAWRWRRARRGDHLREHHRRGLQRLLFLLGIGAPRPVLHHQHAERIAGAQHRHAEEGMVDLLAGLGAVGRGRMVLRRRQVDRVGLAGHQADQAFVERSTVWCTASLLRPSVA